MSSDPHRQPWRNIALFCCVNGLKEYLNKFEAVIQGKQETGASNQELQRMRKLRDHSVEEWLAHDPAINRETMRNSDCLLSEVTGLRQAHGGKNPLIFVRGVIPPAMARGHKPNTAL